MPPGTGPAPVARGPRHGCFPYRGALRATETSPDVTTAAGFLAGYSGPTREAYTLDLRQFIRWCGEHRLGLFDLTLTHIELYARQLEEEAGAATIGRPLSTLAAFYRYATEEGVMDHSPAVYVRRPKLDYESHAVGLDRNELGAFLVQAGLSSGAPVGAFLALRTGRWWAVVDLGLLAGLVPPERRGPRSADRDRGRARAPRHRRRRAAGEAARLRLNVGRHRAVPGVGGGAVRERAAAPADPEGGGICGGRGPTPCRGSSTRSEPHPTRASWGRCTCRGSPCSPHRVPAGDRGGEPAPAGAARACGAETRRRPPPERAGPSFSGTRTPATRGLGRGSAGVSHPRGGLGAWGPRSCVAFVVGAERPGALTQLVRALPGCWHDPTFPRVQSLHEAGRFRRRRALARLRSG